MNNGTYEFSRTTKTIPGEIKSRRSWKIRKIKKENAERIKNKYKSIKELPNFKQKEQRKKWRQAKQKHKTEPNISQTKTPTTDQKEKRKLNVIN